MYCLRQFSESRLVFSFFHISALLAFVAHFSLSVSFVHFLSVFSFRIRDVPPCSLVFSYAAAGLRQFSESRLLLSFFRERKRPHFRPLAGMSKAIPGRRSSSPEAAPPPGSVKPPSRRRRSSLFCQKRLPATAGSQQPLYGCSISLNARTA